MRVGAAGALVKVVGEGMGEGRGRVEGEFWRGCRSRLGGQETSRGPELVRGLLSPRTCSLALALTRHLWTLAESNLPEPPSAWGFRWPLGTQESGSVNSCGSVNVEIAFGDVVRHVQSSND